MKCESSMIGSSASETDLHWLVAVVGEHIVILRADATVTDERLGFRSAHGKVEGPARHVRRAPLEQIPDGRGTKRVLCNATSVLG
jgi:hypothetical protein